MLRTTPQERLALGVAALLLAAGAGARALRPAEPALWNDSPAADTSQTGSLGAVRAAAAARAADEAVRTRPLEPGERVDPNRAGEAELDRIPRVGPALAARIVARRDSAGPYRTLADLDAVPGVGPALLREMAPWVGLPPAPPAAPPPPAPRGAAGAAGAPLALNRASAAELEALPGIGPALATRIVQWRERHGPFASVAELEAVPGVGPALVRRLESHLRAPP